MLRILVLAFSTFFLVLAGSAYAQTVIDTTPFPSSMINKNSTLDGNGDGYSALSYKDRFYFINHHGAVTQTSFDCIDRNTKASCVDSGVTWPQRLMDGVIPTGSLSSTTLYVSDTHVLDGNQVYYPVTRFAGNTGSIPQDWGVGCYNLDTNDYCGYEILSTNPLNRSYKAALTGPFKVGNKYLSLDLDMKLWCLENVSGTLTPCATPMVDLAVTGNMPRYVANAGSGTGQIGGEVVGNKLYLTVNYGGTNVLPASTPVQKRAVCIDTGSSSLNLCSGWASSVQFSLVGSVLNFSNYLYYNMAGTPVSLCHRAAAAQSCVSLADGSSTTNFHTVFDTEIPDFSMGSNPYYGGLGGEIKIGTKTYFPRFYERDRIYCFDWSTAKACSGFPVSSGIIPAPTNYALSLDSDNCVWANGDNRQLWSLDPYTQSIPCNRGSFTNTLEVQTCEVHGVNTVWYDVYVDDIMAADFSSLTLRIKDKNGNWVDHDLLANATVDLTGADYDMDTLEYEVVGVLASGVTAFTKIPQVNARTAPGDDCSGGSTGCEDCELCCPPWTQSQFESIFNWSQNSGTTYNVNYQPTAALDAQMNTWLAYAQTIRPDIQAVNVWFYVLECMDNVPTGSPCPSGFQAFDVKDTTTTMDMNMIQWTGAGSVHKNAAGSFAPGSVNNSGTSITRPFTINRLYRIYALPMLILNDGSVEFIGDGWFGDCPIGEMETNFQIRMTSILPRKGSKPRISIKMVSPRHVMSLRDTREMVKTLKRIIKESKASGTSLSVKTKWTKWLNTDRPGGNGDYQTVKGLMEKGQICAKPVDIECRTAQGKIDWKSTGETVTCNVTQGHLCSNKQQKDGRCEDYEVRFSCPVK